MKFMIPIVTIIAFLIMYPTEIIVSEVYPIRQNDVGVYRVVFTLKRFNFSFTKDQIFYTRAGAENFCKNVANKNYSRFFRDAK